MKKYLATATNAVGELHHKGIYARTVFNETTGGYKLKLSVCEHNPYFDSVGIELTAAAGDAGITEKPPVEGCSIWEFTMECPDYNFDEAVLAVEIVSARILPSQFIEDAVNFCENRELI